MKGDLKAMAQAVAQSWATVPQDKKDEMQVIITFIYYIQY